MIDVVEVLQHWHAGRPKAVVAASLGVDVKTVPQGQPAPAAGCNGRPGLGVQQLGEGLLLSGAQGPHPPGGRDAGGGEQCRRPGLADAGERDQQLLDAQVAGG